MINKFKKITHMKYSRFFGFLFFLRYLLAIFIISVAIFLIVPNFFDYESRAEFIKNHIFKKYNFKISKYEKIKFHALPIPSVEFLNVKINLKSSTEKLNVKNLKIYPKLFSIYNFKDYQSNKLALKDSQVSSEVTNLKFLTKYFLNQKNKLLFDDLLIEIYEEDNLIIPIKNIQFANFGYNQNLIKGEVFGKKFKAKMNNNYSSINFKLIKSGISAKIDFDERKKNDLISGVFKSKILNTNLKFKFNYNNKKLNIYNSYFRSKNISFKNNNEIIFQPFIDFNSKFQIEQINPKIFKKIDIFKLLKSKDIIKKINSKNEVNFKSKKFSGNLIDALNLKIDLAYGRLIYVKKFLISDNSFQCKGNINLLEEYPVLIFDCSMVLNNKQKFLKKFSIKSEEKNEPFKLRAIGNLNIFNKKINFKEIKNETYNASREDLMYFKSSFENILFNKNFLEIFRLEKIKEFILDVS